MNFKTFRNTFFEEVSKKPSWGSKQIKELFDNTFFETVNDPFEESTDDDDESALASAGWGVDESY